jgi:hypothetical protein
LPSFPAVTRAPTAERSFAADRKSPGPGEPAGASRGSVADVFAKLLGDVEIGKDATGKTASPKPAGDEAKESEPPSALAGLAITVTPAPAAPPPTTPSMLPDASVESPAEDASGGPIAPPTGDPAEGEMTAAPAATAPTTGTGAGTSEGIAAGEPTSDKTKGIADGMAGKPVAEPPRATAPASAVAATPGAPTRVLEIAAISAAHAATNAITSALGAGKENASAALAKATLPRAASASRAGSGPLGVGPSGAGPSGAGAVGGDAAKASSLAGIGSVAGGAAAFESAGLDGFTALLDIGGEASDAAGQILANTLATQPGQRPAHPASPLMAAALGFAERLKADAEALAAEADALGGHFGATTGRADATSATLATPPSPGLGREAAVPLPMLASEIARQAERGKKTFDIRLDPPELGKVRVKLDLGQEGEVRAHLIVERKETLDQLQRDQRVLERALQDAGLSVAGGGLQFSLSSGGRDRQGEAATVAAPRRAGGRETEAVGDTALAPPPRPAARPGGIDVRV